VFIRLILTPPKTQADRKKWKYTAVREDTGEFVVKSHQPLYDGARTLIEQGLPGDTLLTMRHAHLDMDSWTPTPISQLAKWTVWELPNRSGLRRAKYRHGVVLERSGIDAEGVGGKTLPAHAPQGV
jgi:hypothetical protein